MEICVKEPSYCGDMYKVSLPRPHNYSVLLASLYSVHTEYILIVSYQNVQGIRSRPSRSHGLHRSVHSRKHLQKPPNHSQMGSRRSLALED
jgi:hypothetical protein